VGSKMQMQLNALLATMLVLASRLVSAQTWELINANEQGSFAIDTSSIKTDDRFGSDSNRKRLWTMILHKQPNKRPKSSRDYKTKALLSFDCDKETYNFLSLAVYAKNGEVIESDNSSTTDEHVIPGTTSALFFKMACSEKERTRTLEFWSSIRKSRELNGR
jgi:hypothetical protein